MAEDFDLIADIREDTGKGASRRLRRQDKVPAIIYGAGRPPRALILDHNKVLQQLESESFYSSVLNIKVGKKSQAAILKDIQRHPARRRIVHMDFQRIVADEEIRMNVPIHFVGETSAPGVKDEGGTVQHLRNDVEVSCLPRYLPEYLEVDVSNLGLDEMLHISDLVLPEGVESTDLIQGPEHDHAIVTIQIVRQEVIEEEEDELGADEVPVEGEEEAAGEDAAESDDGEADD